jgi:hypothetical protein
MRGLDQIVKANREAEALGVADGAAVGTEAYYLKKAQQAAQEARSELLAQVKTGVMGRTEVRCNEGGTQPHEGAEGSGLRGHGVGVDYPFSVVGGFEPGNFGALLTIWTVINYHTGKVYTTFRGADACKQAHAEAHRLADAWKEGQEAQPTKGG